MKIICAGVSKTGTTTMNAALCELGFSVYDYLENFEYLGDEWMKIVEKGWKTEDFQSMYKDIDAVCDSPAFYFWDDILAAFPKAKVILMQRDNEEDWYRSLSNQQSAYRVIQLMIFSLLSSTFRKFGQFSYDVGMVPFGISKLTQMITVPEMPAKQNYRRHNAYVMQTCPKDKLLIFNCKEGWGPLCKFLGVPEPSKPFPVMNVRGQIAVDVWKTPLFGRMKREALTSSCLVFLIAGFAVVKCTNLTNAFSTFLSNLGA